jgi:hypothetical protein
MLRQMFTFTAIMWLSSDICSAAEHRVCITGRVMDESKHPVAHAGVIVIDRATQSHNESTTNVAGLFKIWHDSGTAVDVQAIPPVKTGLAQSMLTKVPGEEGQKLLMTVKKGFELHGRVFRQGRPLKGINVTAIADDDTVHGGGRTTTNGRGEFALVLTPGDKELEITDTRSGTPKVLSHSHVTMTTDNAIQDICVTGDLAEQP